MREYGHKEGRRRSTKTAVPGWLLVGTDLRRSERTGHRQEKAREDRASGSGCVRRGDGRGEGQRGGRRSLRCLQLRMGVGVPIPKGLGPGEGTHLLETRRNLCHRDVVPGDLGTGRTAHLRDLHGGQAPTGSLASDTRGSRGPRQDSAWR